MNGHSSAETLAFGMMRVLRHYGGSLGNEHDTPVFIFSAGWRSGEDELCKRLGSAFATHPTIDAIVVDALARHLLGIAKIARDDPTGFGSQFAEGQKGDTRAVIMLARAQAHFLRRICRAPQQLSSRRAGWGFATSSLTADYALYLKALFPNSRFIFLHRNPIDTFQDALVSMGALTSATESRVEWAATFANDWCELLASFEVWCDEVGGLLLGYERAMADAPREIEEYLGEQLSPLANAAVEHRLLCATTDLTARELKIIVQRTGETAARIGYSLVRGGAAARLPPHDPPRIAPGVHAESYDRERSSCAVLVPAIRYIEPECDDALWELERRGYTVRRMRGCTSIDHARSMLASAAFEDGSSETLWVDADMSFAAEAVERLRSHDLPIVAGAYARRQPRGGFALAPFPGTHALQMGASGGLVEVLYAGTGFVLVRREVYATIKERFNLPVCDEGSQRRAIPFFMPMLEDWGGRLSYLAEDYAFSRRARLCGFKIMVDTCVRLWHVGTYRYGYEDAGNEVPRVATYRHVFENENGRSG
jgi:hypothetical protein